MWLTSLFKKDAKKPIVKKTDKKASDPKNKSGKILMAQFIGNVDL